MNTSKDIFTLEGHTERVNSISFSPDGKYVVSASDDKAVKVWEQQGNRWILIKDISATESQLMITGASLEGAIISTKNQEAFKQRKAEIKDNIIDDNTEELVQDIYLSKEFAAELSGKMLGEQLSTEAIKLVQVKLNLSKYVPYEPQEIPLTYNKTTYEPVHESTHDKPTYELKYDKPNDEPAYAKEYLTSKTTSPIARQNTQHQVIIDNDQELLESVQVKLDPLRHLPYELQEISPTHDKPIYKPVHESTHDKPIYDKLAYEYAHNKPDYKPINENTYDKEDLILKVDSPIARQNIQAQDIIATERESSPESHFIKVEQVTNPKTACCTIFAAKTVYDNPLLNNPNVFNKISKIIGIRETLTASDLLMKRGFSELLSETLTEAHSTEHASNDNGLNNIATITDMLLGVNSNIYTE